MAFQTSVASQQSPGIEGGFYGANPQFSLTSFDEAQLVAGSAGVTIGQFAWANATAGTGFGQVTSAHPGTANVRYGFVHRDQPAVIAALLAGTSNLVVAGQAIDLLEDGPVWARFAGGAAINQKVYMNYADGACKAAATATPATATFTATTTNGSPNLTSVSGAAYAGEPISGTGIPAGAYLVSVNSVAGTAVMSANATASGSITVTRTTNFETAYNVRSTAGSGELAKISVRG